MLLTSSALSFAAPAAAQDATWRLNPPTANLQVPANWSPATVPTGVATFGQSSKTTLTILGGPGFFDIDTFRFNAGAPAYTFITGLNVLEFNGLGIVNSSSNAPTFNVNGGLSFFNSSTAANAIITAGVNGLVTFDDNSTAGTAAITNHNSGVTEFLSSSTAGAAVISNNNLGATRFFDSSTAGAAVITNESLGITRFLNSSTAGTAQITNNAGGFTFFNGASTAANATIINNGGGTTEFGLSGGPGTASADHATIINAAGSSGFGSGGFTEFNASTTAGNATIITENNAGVFFFDNSTGGQARFITNAGGVFDISQLATTGMTAGSIEGAGTYFLGSMQLTVGGNNLSTEVSGVISDGTCGCFGPGGTGGSLVKVGTGTLLLTGINTYTGGTTISAGTLQLGNGGTTGSIMGDVLDNSILAINHSDAVTLAGLISGSGALQQIGTGTTTLTAANTYTGPTTVSAGTLTISATGSITSNVTNNATFNNAGTVTGSLTNIGTANNTGTITGGLTNTGTFNAAGVVNGAIANDAGMFMVTGALTSDGTFANAGGAMLMVGAATYTLQGLLTNDGVITVASGGQLIATAGGIANAASGSITVAAGSTVRDDLNNAGLVTNNGAYFANVASNTGIITNNAAWTGNINNGGAFNNAGTVSGDLTNTAGITTNTGTISGAVTVSGGALTGTGTVGNTDVTSGGIFMPGSGTPGSSMTVTGNLNFAPGAIYVVNVNPATASFANVSGTATPGGATVEAFFIPGGNFSKQYVILNAGIVSGTFAPTVVNFNLPAGFTDNLSYDVTHAYLNLNLSYAPSSGGLNINQQNVANGLINSFNVNGSIPGTFVGLTPAGLTQLSGEVGAGFIPTAFQAGNLFLNLLLNPSLDGHFNTGGFGTFGYAEEPPKAATSAFAAVDRKQTSVFDSRYGFWGGAYGGSGNIDGNATTGSHDTGSQIYGFASGLDYRLTPDTLVGFALAGGGTHWSLDQGLGSGRSDMFQAGLYGKSRWGAAYVSGALAYSFHDVTTNRTVTIAGTDQLQAGFRANVLSGRLEGGYRYATPWLRVTPYGAVQVQSLSLPSYAESATSGSNQFALNYASQTVTTTRTELGARFDKTYLMDRGAVLTLFSRAAWAHDVGNTARASAIFQALPASNFIVYGAQPAPDGALITGGAEYKLVGGWSVLAKFDGEFSNTTALYSGSGTIKKVW